MASVYHGVAVMLVVWAVAFGLLARNAPAPAAAQRKGLGVMIEVLTREKLSWLLSGFYFLTFGGFVAFSIYLPTLLKDEFHLTPADAGFRTAGFVVLATLLRPLGGWLSDRIGGARVLSAVFLGVAPFAHAHGMVVDDSLYGGRSRLRGVARAWAMARSSSWCRSISRLRPGRSPVWSAPWAGSAASFRRCCWPSSAAGPGAIWPGFALLAVTAWLLWWANHKVFVPRQQALDIALPADLRRTADRVQAGAWATLWTALAGRCNCGGLAQSAELRSGTGDLHLRRSLRHLGRGLPLQCLARKTAHASVLGSRLGTVPAAGCCPQPVSRGHACRNSSGRHNVSLPIVPACAGGCTNAFSGDACWRSPSRFRWSSAGSTSARFPATN